MTNKFNLVNRILIELKHAREVHPAFNSAHEGYAVILEELDELWDEVKKRVKDKRKLEEEAVQVAAMAMRFLTDVCGRELSTYSMSEPLAVLVDRKGYIISRIDGLVEGNGNWYIAVELKLSRANAMDFTGETYEDAESKARDYFKRIPDQRF